MKKPGPLLNWCFARMIKAMAMISIGQEKIHPGKNTPSLCNNNTDPTIRINNPAVRLLLWELGLRGFIAPVLYFLS